MSRRRLVAWSSRTALLVAAVGVGAGMLTGLEAAGDIEGAILRGRIASVQSSPAPVSMDDGVDSVIRPASLAVAPADAPLADAMGFSMAAQLHVKDAAACARMDEAYRQGCRTYLDAAPPADELPVESVL